MPQGPTNGVCVDAEFWEALITYRMGICISFLSQKAPLVITAPESTWFCTVLAALSWLSCAALSWLSTPSRTAEQHFPRTDKQRCPKIPTHPLLPWRQCCLQSISLRCSELDVSRVKSIIHLISFLPLHNTGIFSKRKHL